MKKRRALALLTSGAALALAPATAASADDGHDGHWHGDQHTVWVKQAGTHGCGGEHAYTSIQSAVDAVSARGTVNVCRGTYSEDVVVGKAVTLASRGAVVSPDKTDTNPLAAAIGGNNAFTILAAHVTVRGFTVSGATGDGIFVAGDHARILSNTATGNGINGINLDGSSHSLVAGNRVSQNGGGIELANDPAAAGLTLPGVTGTASYDVVVHNHVSDNPAACAIYLVDHAGQGRGMGVHDNLIAENTVDHNALKGFGAGVLIASPVPNGAIYDNAILGNTIETNGLPGVSIHSHVPGQDFSGNAVIGNRIGTNNILGAEPDDKETTGVFIGSQSPLTVLVKGNRIHDNHFGIFTAGPSVTVAGASRNSFRHVDVRFGSSATYEQQAQPQS